jgi:lipopolysaccharide transport system permease protein
MAVETAGPRWTEVRPTTGWFRGLDLHELWTFREVWRALVVRDFRSRYKQAALGVGWALIQPLVGVVLLNFVFGELAGLPSDGLPYPLFVLAGLVVWNYVSGAISAASSSLVKDPDLLTKVYFPRLLAPSAALVPPLVDLAIVLAVALALAAAQGYVGFSVVLVPLWLVAACLVSLGIGSLLAALHVRYRDVGPAIDVFMQLWLFATPVIYPASSAEGAARVLLACNPVTGIVNGFRWSLLGAPPPPPVDLLSLATGIGVLVLGVGYFHRMERRFADVI